MLASCEYVFLSTYLLIFLFILQVPNRRGNDHSPQSLQQHQRDAERVPQPKYQYQTIWTVRVFFIYSCTPIIKEYI